MKYILAGGGTAGHINPAISIANMIKEEDKNAKILFVGTKIGLEGDLVARAGFEIKFIEVKGFKRKLSFDTIKTFWTLRKGLSQARKILKDFKPDLVIGTGGYVSGPVVYVAAKKKIKTLIHEQNALPGITNKILSKYVDTCAVNFVEAEKYFSKCSNIVCTGNIIRKEILDIDKNEARKKLGIKENEKLVCIAGGSQGTKIINDATVSMLENFYKKDDFKLIFAPGKKNYSLVVEEINIKSEDIIIKDYIYDMATVMGASDLIVTRSGATFMSEITAIGIASILVPSSFVAENHQEKNARVLEKVGGCLVILDSEMNGSVLYKSIMKIFKDEKTATLYKVNSYKMGVRDGNKKIMREINKLTLHNH